MPLKPSGRKLTRGQIVAFSPVDDSRVRSWNFVFNPTEFPWDIGAQYNYISSPGQSGTVGQFISTSDMTATIKFLLDSRERTDQSVTPRSEGLMPDLAFFESLVTPEVTKFSPAGNGRFTKPPEVQLVIGQRVFEGLVDKVSVVEKVFSPTLVPLVADVTISFVRQPYALTQNYAARVAEMAAVRFSGGGGR